MDRKILRGKILKNLKKGVDEEKSPVLYYDSRADESREELQRTLKPYVVQDVP